MFLSASSLKHFHQNLVFSLVSKWVQSHSSYLLFWSSFWHCLMPSVIVCHCTIYHTLFICCAIHPLCTCTLQCCCASAITGHSRLIASCWLVVLLPCFHFFLFISFLLSFFCFLLNHFNVQVTVGDIIYSY